MFDRKITPTLYIILYHYTREEKPWETIAINGLLSADRNNITVCSRADTIKKKPWCDGCTKCGRAKNMIRIYWYVGTAKKIWTWKKKQNSRRTIFVRCTYTLMVCVKLRYYTLHTGKHLRVPIKPAAFLMESFIEATRTLERAMWNSSRASRCHVKSTKSLNRTRGVQIKPTTDAGVRVVGYLTNTVHIITRYWWNEKQHINNVL